MNMQDFVANISGNLTVHRVFGKPHTADGTTVIPVAKVMGGGGGGGGNDTTAAQQGEGGGFGMIARPAGVYVIRNGEVRWVPAIDWNRLVVLAAALAFAIVRRKSR